MATAGQGPAEATGEGEAKVRYFDDVQGMRL